MLDLPYTFSTFDYDEMCELLWRECDATFEIADGRTAARAERNGDGAIAVETDRGTVSAPLVVDALGWRRMLAAGDGFQPLDAPLTRGAGGPSRRDAARTSRSGSTAATRGRATAGPSRPARSCGSAPAPTTRAPTSARGPTLLAADLGHERVRYQGNWIPHELRPPTEGGVFFAGDSAGHCLPLTAEGIRTALYYGLAVGREMRAVFEGRQQPRAGARRYARASRLPPQGRSRCCCFFQRLDPVDPAADAGGRSSASTATAASST